MKDLPEDKMLDIQSIRKATTPRSTLIACSSNGDQQEESRPSPISFSVNGNFEVVNRTDTSGSDLKRFAELMRRCGNEYVVIVFAESDSNSSPTLFQLQQAAVEDVVQDEGIDTNRLVIQDLKGKMFLTQYSQGYVGGWKGTPVQGK
jgi:hypothetical protein